MPGGGSLVKILFVITRADSFGGVQVHVRDLATRLLELGHEVRVVTGARGPFSDALAQRGISSVACPALQRAIHPLKDARAVIALRREINAFRPDIVSTHTSKSGIVGRLACALGGPPCLFTAHGWAFTTGVPEPRRSFYRVIERAMAPLATRIICVSEHDRQIAIAAGIKASRLVTIHNGMLDVPASSRADPGGGDPVRIVMLARLAPQKDHRTLLHAFAAVEGGHLDLAGEDGITSDAVRTLVHDLDLEDRVTFMGHQDDVAAVLAQSQIFALISHWEGFPRSTLEAMRAGLPVLVSDAGGAAEAVEDGVTGFVVSKVNIDETRDRLRALVASAERRRAMGSAGRRRYEEEFTFDRMFQQALDLYHEIVPAFRSHGTVAVDRSGAEWASPADDSAAH